MAQHGANLDLMNVPFGDVESLDSSNNPFCRQLQTSWATKTSTSSKLPGPPRSPWAGRCLAGCSPTSRVIVALLRVDRTMRRHPNETVGERFVGSAKVAVETPRPRRWRGVVAGLTVGSEKGAELLV